MILCQGKYFELIIRVKFGLDKRGTIYTLIPSTFEGENSFLDSDTMLISKRHYMTHYRKLRKEFLNYLEDFMTRDCLIGSTISTITKKDASCASKMSSLNILIVNTEISKRTAKSNHHYFNSKNFNHAFLLKQQCERYRNDVKQGNEDDKNSLDVNEYQTTDHPRT
jgi:hypothetical protein